MTTEIEMKEKNQDENLPDHIDAVLIYKKERKEDEKGKDVEHGEEIKIREKYFKKLKESNFYLEKRELPNERVAVLITSSFESLCKEAERMNLRMPINPPEVNKENPDEEDKSYECVKSFRKYWVQDTEEDYMSTWFSQALLQIFQNHDKEELFFRKGLRYMLTYHKLINTDINDDKSPDKKSKTMALHYLIMKGFLSQYLILHDKSDCEHCSKSKSQECDDHDNPRIELDNLWVKRWRYQPLWMIRNYFGEKLAFYFAWSGLMITNLWFPMFLGLICFIYGLVVSFDSNSPSETASYNVTTELERVQMIVEVMLNKVKESFDNDITPVFACIICIWGTIFTESWKRYSKRLEFEWDVNEVHELEPDRPEFQPDKNIKDPVTDLDIGFYPLRKQVIKYLGSILVLLIMLLMVFGSLVSIIVYRVVITVQVCTTTSSTVCLILNLVVSSILNAIAIIILGKLYDKLAVCLTDFENHRTQSSYDNALIVKLFAFQFVNSYSSLFYIAFFRGKWSQKNGLFNLGSEYVDTCGVTDHCMPTLSFQVMVLMIAKPITKLMIDIVLPYIKKHVKCGKVDPIPDKCTPVGHIDYESKKPPLNDFTIPEYMEKILQYGYLVLFAASFPLAPLIAFLTNIIDIHVDGRRLLWMYGRPVPILVNNIGIWATIVHLLNMLGVVSNSFIIGFTSSWGRSLTLEYKLIAILGIEHGLFALKLLLDIFIPDIPQDVRIMKRRELHFASQVKDKLKANQRKGQTKQ